MEVCEKFEQNRNKLSELNEGTDPFPSDFHKKTVILLV